MKVVEDRIRYNVYRGINASDIEGIEWSMLAAGLKDREYSDKDWLSLPKEYTDTASKPCMQTEKRVGYECCGQHRQRHGDLA